tara:strand:+ start:4698 stop:4937 length:240 start_codon:yes stop_codon:yes gene_type:complete
MTAINRNQMVKTMEHVLEGQMARHRINIEVLLDRGVGVAEHPDIMDTIEKELGMMSEYADKLAMLEIVKSGKLSNGKSF